MRQNSISRGVWLETVTELTRLCVDKTHCEHYTSREGLRPFVWLQRCVVIGLGYRHHLLSYSASLAVRYQDVEVISCDQVGGACQDACMHDQEPIKGSPLKDVNTSKTSSYFQVPYPSPIELLMTLVPCSGIVPFSRNPSTSFRTRPLSR